MNKAALGVVIVFIILALTCGIGAVFITGDMRGVGFIMSGVFGVLAIFSMLFVPEL